jgi:hypothetical protein
MGSGFGDRAPRQKKSDAVSGPSFCFRFLRLQRWLSVEQSVRPAVRIHGHCACALEAQRQFPDVSVAQRFHIFPDSPVVGGSSVYI